MDRLSFLAQTTTTPGPSLGPVTLPAVDPLLWRAVAAVGGFLVVVLVGWYVLDPAVSRAIQRRNKNNPTLEEAISRYLRVLVLALAVLVAISGAGFNRLLGDSAIVFAAATLALGVAGQEVIGSLVSGLALVVDPEFNVGNYIRWDGGEGEVTSITLRVTRVQTIEGEPVTIPNTTLTESAVRRPFEGKRSRSQLRVGVDYEDDLDAATAALVDAAESVTGVRSEPAPSAEVEELGGDAVVLRLVYWIDDPRRRRLPVRGTVAREAKERLEAAGVSINPATQRDLTGSLEVTEPA